MQHFVVHSKTV